MRDNDTIVALSSGALPSGVAVIRLSGPLTIAILEQLAGGVPPARHLTLRAIGQDAVLDRGLVAWFPAPHSFTGEDCAELQVHGSPAGVRAILRQIVVLGGRLAEAGEFTRRACSNGKLDLVKIEGLGDLLAAETENQRRQAIARLEGGLSQRIDKWRDQLLDLRAEIEARLDFSDEGDVGDLPPEFESNVSALAGSIQTALGSVEQGRIVREGLRVALAGPPNAGKSSLLNALARSDIAIVTEEAGTTRDVREMPIDIGGQLIIVLDLAGLRETASKAEAEGVRRAYVEIARADLVLWLTAPNIAPLPLPATTAPIWHVATKADLGRIEADMALSARTGEGMEALMQRLGDFATKLAGSGEPISVSRERDRMALSDALTALTEVPNLLDRPELAADALRHATNALERLVGRIDPERVLDQLFARFCIGK